MDSDRTAKLAFARQKLKTHQEKKMVASKPNEESSSSNSYQDDETIKSNGDNCINNVNRSLEQLCYNKETTTTHSPDIYPENGQLTELHSKLLQLENDYLAVMENLNFYKQTNLKLDNDLQIMTNQCSTISTELYLKENIIIDLNKKISKLDENNNELMEQLEFTKNLLTAKESETLVLHNQLSNIQNRLESTELHLQQLSNGCSIEVSKDNNDNNEHCEVLLSKIHSLEQQIENFSKEREQISTHYEQYVREINEQLKSVLTKNEQLRNELHQTSERENHLVQQISEMEIIIQNLRNNIEAKATQREQKESSMEYQQMYESVKEELIELKTQYDQLQQKFVENESKLKESTETIEGYNNYNKISMDKLNADIASDKIAAQKATEQNKKLKEDLHKLEDDFIKMSKDKLELTEKLTAEKYLNRELTIKLSEIDHEAKDIHNKLKAKDEEMIRLQVNLREAEKRLKELEQNFLENVSNNPISHENLNINSEMNSCTDLNSNDNSDNYTIPMGNAMIKLQSRFLKIMDEVADLSDEKQRLEHIILQLQNETDTICEYVALYQQQRGLLKRRDEERNIQIKLFQQECNQLKNQLEELSGILIKLANDEELSVYFKTEPRSRDLDKVMHLLSTLQTNAIIDTSKQCSDFKNFYPCSCCSGQLIIV